MIKESEEREIVTKETVLTRLGCDRCGADISFDPAFDTPTSALRIELIGGFGAYFDADARGILCSTCCDGLADWFRLQSPGRLEMADGAFWP